MNTDIADLIAGALGVSRGTAYDLMREALAEQPAQQQEPVAWMDIDENGTFSGLRYWSEPDNRYEVALYTSPPASKPWVGLTDVERIELMEKTHPKNRWPLLALCEEKLREKNA